MASSAGDPGVSTAAPGCAALAAGESLDDVLARHVILTRGPSDDPYVTTAGLPRPMPPTPRPVEPRGRTFVCYAVRRGWRPGIYKEWNDAQNQVLGYPGHEYRGFETVADAQHWMRKRPHRYGGPRCRGVWRMVESSGPAPNLHRFDASVKLYDNLLGPGRQELFDTLTSEVAPLQVKHFAQMMLPLRQIVVPCRRSVIIDYSRAELRGDDRFAIIEGPCAYYESDHDMGWTHVEIGLSLRGGDTLEGLRRANANRTTILVVGVTSVEDWHDGIRRFQQHNPGRWAVLPMHDGPRLGTPVRHIDLLAGMGEWALAAKEVSWNTLLGVDWDPETEGPWRQMNPEAGFLETDIMDMQCWDHLSTLRAHVWTASLPTKPWVCPGEGLGYNDPDSHVTIMLPLLAWACQPAVVVMDQAPKFTRVRGGSDVNYLRKMWEFAMYGLVCEPVQMGSFLPQHGERVMMIATCGALAARASEGGYYLDTVRSLVLATNSKDPVECGAIHLHWSEDTLDHLSLTEDEIALYGDQKRLPEADYPRYIQRDAPMAPLLPTYGKDHLLRGPIRGPIWAGSGAGPTGQRYLHPREVAACFGFPPDQPLPENWGPAWEKLGHSTPVPFAVLGASRAHLLLVKALGMQAPPPTWFMQQSLDNAQNFHFRGQLGPRGLSSATTVKILPDRVNGMHDVAVAYQHNAYIAVCAIFDFLGRHTLQHHGDLDQEARDKWFLGRFLWNKLMHAINGNQAAQAPPPMAATAPPRATVFRAGSAAASSSMFGRPARGGQMELPDGVREDLVGKAWAQRLLHGAQRLSWLARQGLATRRTIGQIWDERLMLPRARPGTNVEVGQRQLGRQLEAAEGRYRRAASLAQEARTAALAARLVRGRQGTGGPSPHAIVLGILREWLDIELLDTAASAVVTGYDLLRAGTRNLMAVPMWGWLGVTEVEKASERWEREVLATLDSNAPNDGPTRPCGAAAAACAQDCLPYPPLLRCQALGLSATSCAPSRAGERPLPSSVCTHQRARTEHPINDTCGQACTHTGPQTGAARANPAPLLVEERRAVAVLGLPPGQAAARQCFGPAALWSPHPGDAPAGGAGVRPCTLGMRGGARPAAARLLRPVRELRREGRPTRLGCAVRRGAPPPRQPPCGLAEAG